MRRDKLGVLIEVEGIADVDTNIDRDFMDSMTCLVSN